MLLTLMLLLYYLSTSPYIKKGLLIVVVVDIDCGLQTANKQKQKQSEKTNDFYVVDSFDEQERTYLMPPQTSFHISFLH